MKLNLMHGDLYLPDFLPDGTQGVVRCVDSEDLKKVGVSGIVMNTYHLMNSPGISLIRSLGGAHKFMSWDKVILTDSGGFQVFSILRENPKFGTIGEEGVIFKPSPNKKIFLSPEKCIQAQFNLGSDIMMALDYCAHPDDSQEIHKNSVELTIKWAKRSKKEYERLLSIKYEKEDKKPLLFGIIQGGKDLKLRNKCAESLLEIGFSGYGFGGYPLDKKGNLLIDILQYTLELMPPHYPKYAMGIGKPENIVICAKMGYNLFDCVIPTREARKGKLYILKDKLEKINLEDENFYDNLYILDEKFARDKSPVSEYCDCHCCQKFSRAYLHHLFKIEENLALRLATIHNLRFYMQLMKKIKEKYG